MPTFYGPPSDGTVIPEQLETALVADVAEPGTRLRDAIEKIDPAGYDVILLAGQSNMSGRGTGYSTTTDPVHPLIYQYGHKTRTLRAASEPLDMADTPSGIGPGLQFARRYIAEGLNRGRRVLLVPAAHGGTPLVSDAVNAWRYGVEGNLADRAIEQAQQAIAAGGAGTRLVAILWVQGETDGDANVTGSAYQADLDALINGMRADLGAPGAPFVIGGMVPEYLTTGTRAAIAEVQSETFQRVAFAGYGAGPEGVNRGDGNHYNIDGFRLLGRSMFDAYKRAANGLLPDPDSVFKATTAGVESCAQAYSLRTVTTGYTGPLVKVSRDGDTELLDVYATGGVLDQVALLSFAGSGSAYVHTWYDQTGNGRHITQETAAARPTIVATGALITSSGKPAVQFDGVDDVLFNTSPALLAAGGATVSAVINAAAPAGATRWWCEARSTSSGNQYALHQSDELATSRARPLFQDVVTPANTAFRGSLVTFDGTPHQITATDSGTQLAQWVDGATDLAPTSYTRTSWTVDRFAVGGVVRSGSLAPLAMKLSEVAFWTRAIDDSERAAVAASQSGYYTTP